MSTPTDPLYARQWHLPMIGNLRKVWDDYSGAGVRVAIYDDGVQFTHADLAANYDASRHFTYDGITYAPTPLTRDDAHGTACAGLIAAVDDNGRGGTGVAHGATITGMDYLNTLQYEYNWNRQKTSPLYDAAMRWAAGFDIMTNSWGTDPDYSNELNLNKPGNSSAVDAGHFAWVSETGRGGLGTVIVKAAGNDTRNANGDGANASRHTITVAAVEQGGFAADYSNFGSSILVSAPAASVTTDLMGERGYNGTGSFDGDTLAQTDYTSTFGGTSAATPVVAGVVALMLEANAGLGWRDVQSILAMSASHTGSAVGAGAAPHEVGRWLTMGGTHWNGGGSIYHLSYGFGMVDAYAAVRMAEVWSRLYAGPHTSADEVHHTVVTDGWSTQIADSDGKSATPEAQISLDVAEDIDIDSVQVTVEIMHSRMTDLVLYLTGPSGERIMLCDGDLSASVLKWTFAGEAFRGMSSQGTWTIEVHDRVTGTSGRVLNAQLDFYGSANTADDVHHFTDDFAMLAGLQADRQLIEDANGGIDWLNFAAVTGNLSVNLAAGGAVTLNGVDLARLGGGFERLQAGDGRDALTGNGLRNVLNGGRGNDRLSGGKGADRLAGEDGNDRLKGGGGSDALTGGAGRDVFLFAGNFGKDRITDWTDDQDSLQIDGRAIWGAEMTVEQMLSTYGSVVGGSAVLTFGLGTVLTLQGVTDLAALVDDITLL